MKASTAAVIANNVELVKQADAFKLADDAVANFGKTALEVSSDKISKLQKSLVDLGAEQRQLLDNLHGARNGNDLGFSEKQIADFQNRLLLVSATIKAVDAQIEAEQLANQKIQEDNLVKHQTAVANLRKSTGEAVLNLQKAQALEAVSGTEGEADKKYAIEEVFAEKELALKVSTAQKLLALEQQYGGKDNADKVRALEAEIDKIREEYAQKQSERLAKEKDELKKTLDQMAADARATAPQIQIVLPKAVEDLLEMRKAAQQLGITLRGDLTQALETAKQAKQDFIEAGGKDQVALRAFDLAIQQAQRNVDNYGKSLDKLKAKGETTFKGLVQDLKQGVDVTHELSAAGIQAFDQMSKSLEGAISSAILGQKSFGKALEEATAQALAQLAAQALVKSLFYTAEGFAALAGFAYGPASQYFEAAGIMAAVGAAAGVSAKALSGGQEGQKSSSPGNQTTNSNVSNTGSEASGRVSGSGVQQFGDGALVSSPTLAMIGERAGETEAVLPLDHPSALQKIGQAIASAGGTGGSRGIHVHVQGMISDDNLAHVIAKINRKVKNGGAELTASNSLRTTKRSL
jgi:hypothetical protein